MEQTLLQRLTNKPEIGPLILLLSLIAVFTAINPVFLSPLNVSNALSFTVELGLIALAMTLLMTAGEFDLSVGSVFGFSAVLMWTLINGLGLPMIVAFVLTIAFALFIGWANGMFVTRLNIPSFLVTLAMLLIVRGTALYTTKGFPPTLMDPQGEWLAKVLVGEFYIGDVRLYMSLLWFILIVVGTHYLLTQTRTGNWIQAAGGNANAARARGVPVDRIKVRLFMLCSAMAAFAGIISSIRVTAANPNSGTGYELEVIAMVVIGGTVLTGGRGTIIGTVLGIFILRFMRNGIVMIGVDALAYNIFIGAIILAMMVLHTFIERRRLEGA
jgi:simple sugar transport system permease protein